MSTIHRTRLILSICLMLSVAISQWVQAATPLNRDQAPVEWQRYTVSGEEFSVLLPVVPAMSTSDMYLDARKSRRERILAAYSNGVVYVVYTFEKKSLSLDDLIGRLANRGETMEPVTVDGITGKRFSFETDNRMGAVQLFAAGKNLYVFQVSGSRLGDPVAGMAKFFSSIRLGNQPEGNQVPEGAGEQPTSNSETPLINPSIFSGKVVTAKAVVITKPEPRYTKEARKNGITGTVVLRAVFSSSGVVTNIHPVTYLPDGLTEQSIEAAKQIRFIPAVKDGRFVSMWMELQYNYNLF